MMALYNEDVKEEQREKVLFYQRSRRKSKRVRQSKKKEDAPEDQGNSGRLISNVTEIS